jgi:adenine deaminase
VLVSVKSDDADLARRLNQEAGKSIMYTDMTREEAIKLVTINPARQLMVSDRIGSVKVGKDADFVIWNDVPLSIYSKPLQTWIEGRKYFDINRDDEMREQLNAEKNALVQKVLAEKDKGKSKKGKGGDRGPDPGDSGPEEQGGRP